MSNATVSSQVYILRTNAALSAVNAGTMILYSDDTHVFAKDQAGNIYNLCTPNASNLSVSLDDLDDVIISSLTASNTNYIHVLRYDAQTSKWVNEDLVLNLGQLADVSSSTPTDGDALVYQASSNSFIYSAISSSGADNLGDHTATEPLKMGTHAIEGNTLDFVDTNAQIETANFNFMGKNITSFSNPHQPARLVLYCSDGVGSDKHVAVQSQRAGLMGDSYTIQLPTSAPTANQVLAAPSSISSANDVALQWTAPTAGIGLTDLSVSVPGSNTPGGSLTYDNSTGVFTYTPASTTALQNWTEDSSGHIVPNTTELHNLGSADNKVKDLYVSDGGSGKIYLDATGSADANTTGDFASISTSGDASGRLDFKSHPDAASNAHLYDFGASDNFPAKVILQTGNAGKSLAFEANASSSVENQLLRFPVLKGGVGDTLAISSITGAGSDELVLAWTPLQGSQLLRSSLNNHNYSVVTGSSYTTGRTFYAQPGVDPKVLENNESWAPSGSTTSTGLIWSSYFSNDKFNKSTGTLAFDGDLDIRFAETGTFSTKPSTTAHASIKIEFLGEKLDGTVVALGDHNHGTINWTTPGTQFGLNIPEATLTSNFANDTGFQAGGVPSDVEKLIIKISVYDLSTVFIGSANSELSLTAVSLSVKLS